MNRLPSPNIRDLAIQLLALEAGAGIPSGRAAASVSEKLSGSLSPLVGVSGYRSLLSRALALSKTEVTWLKAVNVTVDKSLEGLAEAEAHVSSVEVANGEAILIAHLLGLLVTFIGESLTLRLVQDVWPKGMSRDFDDKDKNL